MITIANSWAMYSHLFHIDVRLGIPVSVADFGWVSMKETYRDGFDENCPSRASESCYSVNTSDSEPYTGSWLGSPRSY